jgi:hypothetical protein
MKASVNRRSAVPVHRVSGAIELKDLLRLILANRRLDAGSSGRKIAAARHERAS